MRNYSLLLVTILFLTGCASYSARSAPVPKLETLPASASQGEIVIGADPYVQEERQIAVFDGNLVEEGILPIQLFVLNNGTRKVLIRRSDIVLLSSDGNQLTPAGAFAVASKLEKTSSHFWPTFFFGIVGAFAAESASDTAKTARREDCQSKEFKDITLEKAGSSFGFVYFIPPAGTESFKKAVLIVRCVDTENSSSFVIKLPLSF